MCWWWYFHVHGAVQLSWQFDGPAGGLLLPRKLRVAAKHVHTTAVTQHPHYLQSLLRAKGLANVPHHSDVHVVLAAL
jgi:hypothetical protein